MYLVSRDKLNLTKPNGFFKHKQEQLIRGRFYCIGFNFLIITFFHVLQTVKGMKLGITKLTMKDDAKSNFSISNKNLEFHPIQTSIFKKLTLTTA